MKNVHYEIKEIHIFKIMYFKIFKMQMKAIYLIIYFLLCGVPGSTSIRFEELLRPIASWKPLDLNKSKCRKAVAFKGIILLGMKTARGSLSCWLNTKMI